VRVKKTNIEKKTTVHSVALRRKTFSSFLTTAC